MGRHVCQHEVENCKYYLRYYLLPFVIIVLFISLFYSAGKLVSISHAAESARVCEGDADCDGLADDREDFDGDGVVDVDLGETDPSNPDSDGDGLDDGEERLHLGRVGDLLAGKEFYFKALDRLDPGNPDSDGDCIPDGVELGIAEDDARGLVSRMPAPRRFDLRALCLSILADHSIPVLANAVPFDEASPPSLRNIAMLFDADPKTMTDPTADDTDDDGVIDGFEDYNFNGRRDGLESDDEASGRISEDMVWLEMDPLLPDSDGDGILDGFEGDLDGDGELGPHESDPLSGDTDGDGVSDGDEERAGTGLNICDTDGDGLSDGVEMGRRQPYEEKGCHGLQASGTNYRKPGELDPLNPDSDGDGLADGAEDSNGNGWVDPDDTDPSIVDTDRDGLSDGVEATGDFDGDGVPDFDMRLISAGRDCTPPEVISDLDCDGVPNARDDDSDNDGCPDVTEDSWADSNSNGIPDVYDMQAKVCPDEVQAGGRVGMPSESPGEDEDGDIYTMFASDGSDGGACQLMPRGGRADRIPAVFLLGFVLLSASLINIFFVRLFYRCQIP